MSIARVRSVNVTTVLQRFGSLGEPGLDLVVVFSVPQEIVLVLPHMDTEVSVQRKQTVILWSPSCFELENERISTESIPLLQSCRTCNWPTFRDR